VQSRMPGRCDRIRRVTRGLIMLKPFHRNDFTQLLNGNDHQRPIVSWPVRQ
jgi:hypothetical protein